ncbi:MAG: PD40 domain-containing protein, partial [Acidobacteria bacterium]|nr:PD40 domain-containing protein [Acidobacteriota bacterium]
ADGKMRRVSEAGIGPSSPAVTARGRRLAYVTRVADTNIWRATLSGGKGVDVAAVTTAVQMDTGPRISPDGRWMAWRSATSGNDEVWVSRADGSEARQLTRMNGPITGSAQWSPDGQRIVFESRPAGNADLFVMEARGGGTMRPLTSEKSNEVLPSYSRDGKSVYYSTDRAGVWEVWRMEVESGEERKVAGAGAFAAVEGVDGKWVYFTRQSGEAGIWRVPVGGGAEERLTDELAGRLWGQWALSAKGLFYAVFDVAGGRRAIRRLDLATRTVTDVVALAKLPVQYDSGMSVAADESWIAWAQLDTAGSSVYVVDGFR